jgi:hypothetical protein
MNRINGKMRSNDPTDYLQKSSRRRILSLSAGALTTGVAGCSGLGIDDDQLSASDKSALQTYTNSYEWSQQGIEKYNSGINTFRDNLVTNNEGQRVIRGERRFDWPELIEKMREATGLFSDAKSGFEQARRSASSSIIQSRCEEAVQWTDHYERLCSRFSDYGKLTEEFVSQMEQQISNLTPPLPPEEVKNEL